MKKFVESLVSAALFAAIVIPPAMLADRYHLATAADLQGWFWFLIAVFFVLAFWVVVALIALAALTKVFAWFGKVNRAVNTLAKEGN